MNSTGISNVRLLNIVFVSFLRSLSALFALVGLLHSYRKANVARPIEMVWEVIEEIDPSQSIITM